MAEKIDISNINKFDGNNYPQWKFQIKCALKAKGIYEVIDGSKVKPTEPGETLNAWIKKDANAMFTLTSAMDLSQITLIENCDSAKDIVDKLDSIYMQKSEVNKMLLYERFHQYKMNASDSIAQHISKVENLAKQVRESGESVSEAAVMIKILSTLPAKYRTVRQAWLSLEESKQNIPNLTARLLDEEASLSSYEEADTALATVAKNEKKPNNKSGFKNIICYKCRKKGHIAKNCRSKQDEQGSTSNKSAFNTEVVGYNKNIDCLVNTPNVEEKLNYVDSEWILDSGASAHMCCRREFFATFESTNSLSVVLGNNQTLTVKGKGTIEIKKLINDHWYSDTINNVLFIPELKKNLFSEGVIASKGMKIVKEGNEAKIYDSYGLAACALREANNIYKLLFQTVVAEANVAVNNSLKMWHERLGHLNIKSLREMVSKGLIEGVKLNGTEEEFFCDACAYGKQHKIPFKKEKEPRKLKLGERIFSDVCGPMNVASVQGSKYFVLFKDDYSGYRVVNFIKHKSDVLDCLKSFNNKLKNKFGSSMQVLHVDNGTEYCNTDLKSYLMEQGIELETTAPYTPEQNGRAERDNRTIVESARSMIHGAGVPDFLWAEAVNTAVYILNRTQTSQVPNSTPYEVWHSRKPTLSHVRAFGSQAFVHIPDQKRTKLEPKSKKLVLVGYENESNNYRLYDPKTRKVTVSRNVIFNEKEKGFQENKTTVKITTDENLTSETEPEACEGNFNNNRQEEEEEETPSIRPQRAIRFPQRFDDFELNFVEIDIPNNYEEALKSENCTQWKKAIDEELNALNKNETWEFNVLPENKKIIDSKWVFKVKRKPDGTISRFKARLCAKGYSQQKGEDYNEVFAPTTRYDSIRVLLAVTAQHRYHMKQFDIKTAFLYGELDHELYMTPPEGVICKPGLVCKLKKSLYGLKQSPRCWNRKFHNFLESFGFHQSNSDKCVYKGHVGGIKVFLIIYVDDGLVISPELTAVEEVLCNLRNTFEVTISEVNYFVGMQIFQNKIDGSIFISQKNYIEQIVTRFGLHDANPVSIPADPHTDLSKETGPVLEEGEVPYRQAIGSLMFASIVTRPDISHAVGVASRYVNCPTQARWNAVKRIIKYLLGTSDYGIHYKSSEGKLTLTGFSDSDYASDSETRRSTTGYVFKLCSGPVTWASKKQTSVCLSTTEAEYVAVSNSTKEAIWLQELLSDIDEQVVKPTVIKIDNQSAIKLIRNPEFHNRTKHIDVRYHFVREKFESGVISPEYINTTEQEADMFTKDLPRNRFEKMRGLIGVKKKKKMTIKNKTLN